MIELEWLVEIKINWPWSIDFTISRLFVYMHNNKLF